MFIYIYIYIIIPKSAWSMVSVWVLHSRDWSTKVITQNSFIFCYKSHVVELHSIDQFCIINHWLSNSFRWTLWCRRLFYVNSTNYLGTRVWYKSQYKASLAGLIHLVTPVISSFPPSRPRPRPRPPPPPPPPPPPQWLLLLTSKPFQLDLRYLGQIKYRSGKMYWMTCGWPWPKVTAVTLINKKWWSAIFHCSWS